MIDSPLSLNNPPLYSNINHQYANPLNTHNPYAFGSINTSSKFGSHGIGNNVEAAAASKIVGGSKSHIIKRKIKNISNKYRTMGGKSHRRKSLSHIKKNLRNVKKTASRTEKKVASKFRKTARRTTRDLSDAKRELISLLSRKKRYHHHHKSKTHKRKHHRGSRKLRGGYYHQYMSNVPFTPSYSTGGPLAPSESALANPVIFERQNHCDGA